MFFCETNFSPSHSPNCTNEEFCEMLKKARKLGYKYDIVCKECFKKIKDKKKIIFKSKNLYVILIDKHKFD